MHITMFRCMINVFIIQSISLRIVTLFQVQEKKKKQMKAKAKYPKAYLGTCQTSLGVIIKYIRKIFRKTNKAATKRVL